MFFAIGCVIVWVIFIKNLFYFMFCNIFRPKYDILICRYWIELLNLRRNSEK